MRVLVLAEVSGHTVTGGSGRVIREQARTLQGGGHEVSLVVRAVESDSRSEVSFDGIAEFRYEVCRSSAPAFVASSVSASLRSFDRVVKQARPDAVVVHQSLAGWGPIVFRRNASPNWIYVFHSPAHEEYLTRNTSEPSGAAKLARTLHATCRRWIERAVVRRSDRVVVLSHFMKQRAMTVHGVPEDSISVIPGAADFARFSPPTDKQVVRAQLGLPEKKTILLTVRNLIPRMGLEKLIEAMACLEEGHEDAILLIGGTGPMRSRLESLIRSAGLETRVALNGFIPEDRLPAHYQSADLTVLPSQMLEGFGMVTVESLACGTPVLGTPVGAIPEVLSPIDPCLLAGGTDARSIAEGIKRVITKMRDDPAGWAAIGRRGLQRVRTMYNWETHCRQLESVLVGDEPQT